MTNSTTNNDEPKTKEKKNTHSFFTRNTLNKTQNELTSPSHESDDITPFYVLGYN